MKKLFASIAIGLLVLLAVSTFVIMAVPPDIRLRSDNDNTRINSREKFMQQWNDSKIAAVEEAKKIAKNKQNELNTPTSEEVQEWMNYVESLSVSDERKKILVAALECKKRGVVYHQLRGGTNIRSECKLQCGCETNTEIHPDDNGTYTFATHARYSVDSPLYLDCSYFVKHCYWKAGIEVNSSNTGGFYDSSEWSTISKEQLEPGDIAVKRGHIVIYMATNENGVPVWIEMGSHATDCKISAYEQGNAFIYRKFNSI